MDIINNFNVLSEKFFKILQRDVFPLIDQILEVNSSILAKEPLKDLMNGKNNGMIMLANTLLLLFVLFYIIKQLIFLYNGDSMEDVYYFLGKFVFMMILVNNSYEICKFLFEIFDSLSDGITKFCFSTVNQTINFELLGKEIMNIKGMDSADFISVAGLIKGILSGASISLLITLSIRYVTIIFLILVSPFAFLCLYDPATVSFSKIWFRTLLINLLIEIFIKLIILIPILYDDKNSDIYKVIVLGCLYLMSKISSFISAFFTGIFERLKNR